jgi:hypothetical protein
MLPMPLRLRPRRSTAERRRSRRRRKEKEAKSIGVAGKLRRKTKEGSDRWMHEKDKVFALKSSC